MGNNKEGHTLPIQTLNNDLVVRFRWFTKELVPTPTLSTDHSLLHVRHVTQPDIRPTPRHVTAHQATMIHVPALQASSPSIRQDLAETSGDKLWKIRSLIDHHS